MGRLHVKFHEDRCKGEAFMRLKPFYLTARLQTDGQTDRQTDGQGDSSIPPPNFVAGGIIICYSVLRIYCISIKSKSYWCDKSEHFIITVRTLQGLWYFTTTLLCMYLQRLLLKNMPFLYMLIKKILKIFYWGRNLQGRTGKGPKPLGAEPEKGRNLWHSSPVR